MDGGAPAGPATSARDEIGLEATGIIGLGCIGGSLAQALHGREGVVRAWSASPDDRAQASAIGLPVAESLAGAVEGVRIVVLAVPAGEVRRVAEAVLAVVPGDVLLLHVTGLQRPDVLGLDPLLAGRVFGTHPMAGCHDAGFAASRPDLFDGCTVYADDRLALADFERARALWLRAGAARVERRPAEWHDRLMVWASQLPQLTATALAATLACAEIPEAVTGPGARDTTRLAASAASNWIPLLHAGAPDVVAALAALERTIAIMREALATEDDATLLRFWDVGRAWRTGPGDGS